MFESKRRWTILVGIIYLISHASAGPAQYNKCPSQCKCNQQITQCENLDITRFGTKVFNLKVANPQVELTLRKNLFADIGLKDVHTIFIENARIKKIDKDTFAGLDSLRSLSLINCVISDFDPSSIAFPASLEQLSFSGTPIKSFNLNLGSLAELDLSNCNLTVIDNDMFTQVPKLVVIKLAHNNIHTLGELAFSKLEDMDDIDLSDNKIHSIPNELFKYNEDLVSLDISNNPLSSILNLKFAPGLEKLVLRNCNLIDFDNVSLEILSDLDLSHNNLQNIKRDAFAGLPQLLYIDLSFNNITTLNADVFQNNPGLIKIVLDSNSIYKLPRFYSKQPFATSIFWCDNCDLFELAEDTFKNMPAIGQLKLSNNQIENIGTTFQNLHALTYLDLSENGLIEIELNAFQNNSALRILNLSGNALKEIDPKVFKNTKVLRELDVSYNSLVTVWKQVTDETLSSITEINASSNQIKHVLLHDLQVTPNLQVFDISDNDIDCSTDFKEAIDWLKINNVLPRKELTKMNMKLEQDSDLLPLSKDWICKGDKEYDEEYYDTDYDETTKVINDDNINNFYEIDDHTNVFPVARETIVNTYRNPYFWPIFVFFATTVIVLLVAANTILFILRKKGSIGQARPITMPRVKLLPYSNKIKKHSGSVYRPLSEENVDTRSIYSSNADGPTTNML